MKITSLKPIFILCSLLIPGLLFANLTETFQTLKTGYHTALSRNEDHTVSQFSQLDENCMAALKKAADDFRARGNLGYYLEIRTYAELIDRHQLNPENPGNMESPYLKDFHQKYVTAREKILKQEQFKAVQIMEVMKNHLSILVADCTRAGELELAALVKAELTKIQEDEDFQKGIENLEAARAAQIARRNAPVQPPPTAPTPRPVMATKPLLDVNVSKKNLAQHAGGWDYDDQIQNIRLLVNVRSKELVRDYEQLKVHVWSFGQDVNNRNGFRMQIVETLKIDGLSRGHSKEIETKTFANLFDDNKYAKFGHKFYGYLLIIEDKDGVELFRKVSPSRLEGKLEQIREHAEGTDFKL